MQQDDEKEAANVKQETDKLQEKKECSEKEVECMDMKEAKNEEASRSIVEVEKHPVQKALELLPSWTGQWEVYKALSEVTPLPYDVFALVEEYDRDAKSNSEAMGAADLFNCLQEFFALEGMSNEESKEYDPMSKKERWKKLAETVKPLPLRSDSRLFTSYIDGTSEYSLHSIMKRMFFMSWLHRETNYGSLLSERSYARSMINERDYRRDRFMRRQMYGRGSRWDDIDDDDDDCEYTSDLEDREEDDMMKYPNAYREDDELQRDAVITFLEHKLEKEGALPSEYDLIQGILHPPGKEVTSSRASTIDEPSSTEEEEEHDEEESEEEEGEESADENNEEEVKESGSDKNEKKEEEGKQALATANETKAVQVQKSEIDATKEQEKEIKTETADEKDTKETESDKQAEKKRKVPASAPEPIEHDAPNKKKLKLRA